MDDKTFRGAEPVANGTNTVTVRVSASQPAASGNGEMTVRPGENMQGQTGGEVEFLLKGRMYRSIKCLSDNSGEAQVFLVEGEEGQRVLKVYYPNFTIKKTLMRIIQNIGMEMIVRIYDYGKTYVDVIIITSFTRTSSQVTISSVKQIIRKSCWAILESPAYWKATRKCTVRHRLVRRCMLPQKCTMMSLTVR